MCCKASLHDFQWGLYKQVWVCGNNGQKDVWQSILPHILPQRKSLNDSFTLRIRWEFVGLDPNEISTKFQRFVLWQNVVAKRFATNQHFVKMFVFFDFWGVAKCFVTTFLHQKKPWNFVKISLGKRPNPRNPDETKSPKSSYTRTRLQMVKYPGRATLQYIYIHIYVCIYVYYNIYIYLCLWYISGKN